MSRGGKREKAGRKTSWDSKVKFEETGLIRIPNRIKDKVLEIAHRLDAGEEIDFVSNLKRQEFQELELKSELIELENQKLIEQIENYRLDLETESNRLYSRIYDLEQKNLDLQNTMNQAKLNTLNGTNDLVTKSMIQSIEIVTKSIEHTQTELFNTNVDNNIEFLKPLTAAELSRRFGKRDDFVKKRKFYYKNRLDELFSFLKQTDPQDIGWQYSEKDKKYHPVFEN